MKTTTYDTNKSGGRIIGMLANTVHTGNIEEYRCDVCKIKLNSITKPFLPMESKLKANLKLVNISYNEYHKFWAIIIHDLNKIASGNGYLYIMNDNMMGKAKELTKEFGVAKSKEPTFNMLAKSYDLLKDT